MRADASGEKNYKENNPARREANFSEAYPRWIDQKRNQFLIRQTRRDFIAVEIK
jgi:hypothetical protein